MKIGQAYGSAALRSVELYYPKEKRLFEDPWCIRVSRTLS